MAQPAGVGSSVNADLGGRVRAVQTIVPTKMTASTNGVAVDLKGYDSAMSLIHVGDSLDTLAVGLYHTFTLEESDDGSTGLATIPASGLRHDLNDFTTTTTPASDQKVIQTTILAGTGRKRYVRAVVTLTGTHTNGTPIGATIVKGNPRVNPATM